MERIHNYDYFLPTQLEQLSKSKPIIYQNCVARANQIIQVDPSINLNKDDLLSIVCYTSPLQIYDNHNYQILPKCINHFLRATPPLSLNGTNVTNDWKYHYSILLASSLLKMPLINQGQNYFISYRGVSGLQVTGEVGQIIVFKQFLSTSKDKAKATRFIHKFGTGSMLIIRGKSGRDISKYSYYKTEEEILFLPASSFSITSKDISKDIWEIELTQQ